MRHRDDDVFVELLPDGQVDPPLPSGAPADRTVDAGPPRRRRWWWPAGAAVLALAVSAGTAEWRQREALREYADVPGVVGSLRGPVQELWRLPATERVWGRSGLVVRAHDGAVVAREAGTGLVRWSTRLPAGAGTAGVSCPLAAGAGDGVLVCWMPRAATGDGATVDWGLDVLDPSDGSTLRRIPTPRPLLGGTSLEGDLVLAEAAEDGIAVVRRDVLRGVELWRTHLDVPAWGDAGLRMHGTSDVVVLEGSTTAVLAAADGREIGRWQAPTRPVEGRVVRVLSRPGEGFGVWTSEFSATWYGMDGLPRHEIDGYVADPPVLDDSTPWVVLLGSADGDDLRAVDVRNGAQLWERTAAGRLLLRLGGRVVVAGEDRITAVDVATGQESWVAELEPGDQPALGPAFTDGLRVLVRGQDQDGRLRLTAYALSTGERLWQTPLPAGSRYVSVLADHLVAVAGTRRGDPGASIVVLG